MTTEARLDKVRAMFARTTSTHRGEAFTAARMARDWMKKHGITEDELCDDWRLSAREREYVRHNFRTAQRRWAEMDAEATRGTRRQKEGRKSTKAQSETKQRTAEPGYRLIWVNGHYRTRGTTRFWVRGHYRQIKAKVQA
jgi:hypothetical protein